MTGAATVVCLALALLIALITGWQAARNHPAGRIELAVAALLEIAVVVYIGVRSADLIGGHHPPSTAIVAAYLVGLALVMPIAAALAIVEPSRWSSVTLGSGALIVCVLFARIHQLWTQHG